ncbi:putative ABC transport system ATP-binding protein [Amphibacillus marinus]|uniref:Putative hemin import ATP-binding protein HrtA n=1 Tax=Amphibacillus marinus TaxID=872970 RepID=A0A1H8LE60_9BACI|nr:ABC transporter ATP-binding protein [Amphibacillus marinus]SEO03431.1 putative ABC transport system ATP-binding protein [Amphibacillus marinus]
MKAIEFINVERTFKDGDKEIVALQSTNFSIDRGQFVAIIGPSGSGKSTFLTIAGGLQAPSKGEVKIAGQAFSSQSEKKRSRTRFSEIGFILQASNLVPFLTIKQQLQLVNKVDKKKQREEMLELLNQLDIKDLQHKYPSEISGGQRQRAAIARALYNDPTIILADEPTASLDSEKAYQVVEILARETKKKNKATIMVTHDIRLVEYCDQVFEMKDGVLKEKSPDSLSSGQGS